MRSWTAYWRHATVKMNVMGGPCDQMASDNFRDRGVSVGDRVFVLSYFDGELHIIGAMTVEQIVDQRAAERLMNQQLWDARDHLVALDPKNYTLLRSDSVVPKSDVKGIEFVSPKGSIRG